MSYRSNCCIFVDILPTFIDRMPTILLVTPPPTLPLDETSTHDTSPHERLTSNASAESQEREWKARLDLKLALRGEKTVLAHSLHEGPLRVQRPFYPEANNCCHIYLLHPPGGLAIGDRLSINIELESGRSLVTTPSAGKVYGLKGLVSNQRHAQGQYCNFRVADESYFEWLPQETIVFDGAEVLLRTKIELAPKAKIFTWDIVCLGRPAGDEPFRSGHCTQSLELWRDGKPLFIEKNHIEAGSVFCDAQWGMQGQGSTGTLISTMSLDRDAIDELYLKLAAMTGLGATKDARYCWALTQKDSLFIARYLGPSAAQCRYGFELIWRETRELFNQTSAVIPRIWNT
ncbi:MAG: urease accessory protein [Flavobacteriales bacterium]